MNKSELLEIFEKNLGDMTNMILSITAFSLEPDIEICKTIEAGLKKTAEAANADAAAIYCAVTADGNCGEAFSKETAVKLIFGLNALDKYHALLENEFKGMVDEEFYDYLYSAPSIWHAELMISSEENSVD